MLKRTILSFLMLLAVSAFCQDATAWKPIGLTISGSNSLYGVSAFYQVGDYNGENVVFMKFVNHNPYAVNIEWNPAVFTNEYKWIRKEEDVYKRSISLEANSALAADCTGTAPAMVFKLKDFPVEPTNVIRYGVFNFNVSKK